MALVFPLSIYKIIFVFELLAAEALFVYRMERRKFFVLRLFGALAVVFAAAIFIPVAFYNTAYVSALFVVLFALSLGAIAFCFKGGFVNVLFCGIAGYSVQHLAYQVVSLVAVSTGLVTGGSAAYGTAMPEDVQLVLAPISIVISFAAYWAVFLLTHKRIEWKNLRIKNTSMLVLVGIILIADVALNAYITYDGNANWSKVYSVAISLASIICCVLTLWVQFGLIEQKKLRNELDGVYHLYRQQQKQFEASKTNIELINKKCHDLKYQVRAIAAGGADENVIREIQDCISIYDSEVKTGNNTLDILLTEKTLYCRENGITFTVVADGDSLGFINEIDMFVLFGNALDNAIEAVAALEPERRVISLTTHSNNDLISVVLRNYCDRGFVVDKDDGLPQTSKNDADWHGFGLRSIRDIAEKYGGDVFVTARDGVFNLNMLFFKSTTVAE